MTWRGNLLTNKTRLAHSPEAQSESHIWHLFTYIDWLYKIMNGFRGFVFARCMYVSLSEDNSCLSRLNSSR